MMVSGCQRLPQDPFLIRLGLVSAAGKYTSDINSGDENYLPSGDDKPDKLVTLTAWYPPTMDASGSACNPQQLDDIAMVNKQKC